MIRKVVIASGNAHKIEEIGAMLQAQAPELEVVGMKSFGQPPEIEETATTFSGNAALKSTGIAAWLREQGAGSDILVLSDDSGICIDALDGRPGVYSARFAGEGASDPDNNAKMVEELDARGLDASAAHYACVLSLARVDGRPVPLPMPESGEGDIYVEGDTLCIEGQCFGEVRTEARGTGGFGYDPHFWVDDRSRTFAEFTQEAKAERSHRGAAMRLLLGQLSKILAADPDVG
jgi:XTP/dITP diphosphohydrolase